MSYLRAHNLYHICELNNNEVYQKWIKNCDWVENNEDLKVKIRIRTILDYVKKSKTSNEGIKSMRIRKTDIEEKI